MFEQKEEIAQNESDLFHDTHTIEQFAELLREIDEKHGRKTEGHIKDYERAFDADEEELLKGVVLNIGDPFIRLPADHKNVISLDYFYGTDAEEDINRLEKEANLSEHQKETLAMYRRWIVKTKKAKQKADGRAVKGVFPALPFRDESFNRVLSLNAISMHPFDELTGFSQEQWRMWWTEIIRVLKPGGSAYIGPFDRLNEHETFMMKKMLARMQGEGILAYRIQETEDNPPQGPEYVYVKKLSEEEK